MIDQNTTRMPMPSRITVRIPTHSPSTSTLQYTPVTLPNPPWSAPANHTATTDAAERD